jgi:hypothetical protein
MLSSSTGPKSASSARPPTRLGNMINLMNGSLGDYLQLHGLSLILTKDENRAQAIMWMKQVRTSHSPPQHADFMLPHQCSQAIFHPCRLLPDLKSLPRQGIPAS